MTDGADPLRGRTGEQRAGGGMRRREFLQAGGLGVGALALGSMRPGVATARAAEVGASQGGMLDYVDPLIGTQSARTFPAVGVPSGMTQWTAATSPPSTKCVAPYVYDDTAIQGFRGSHWNNSCMQDYGSVTLMAVTGALAVQPAERASRFSHDRETARPSYYSVDLADYGVRAEVTATARVGFLRLRFPAVSEGYVVVDSDAAYEPTTRDIAGEGWIMVIPETREIIGYNPVHRMYQGWGQPAGFSGFFVVRFSRPFADFGVWNAGVAPQAGAREADDRPGAYVRFELEDDGVVLAKVGTSFVSIDGARANLDAEINAWGFEPVVRASESAWEEALGAIRVDGGSDDQRKSLYTALYHSMLFPRRFSDVDGAYPEFDGNKRTRHVNGRDHYMDFSLWDTFRAVHPLMALTQPSRASDMVQSLVAMSDEGGWLPVYPMWNSYTSEMIGDHTMAVIADAYAKGITGFDTDRAYALMRQNALELPSSYDDYAQGKGRRALDSYLKYSYVPLDDPVREAFHQGEQVSRTLEYSYDDFCLARFAQAIGRDDDHRRFLERAGWYANVIDPSVGLARGRWADGSWAQPYDPLSSQPYITESTPWIYSWFAPHDVAGLVRLMGGADTARERLKTTFEHSSERGFSGPYYDHGNEPSHHIAYLFNYVGAPWLTQKWVREIMGAKYHPSPTGLAGDDDAGQMSAWYVFSAIGLYPVCPGWPYYALGSPLFDEVQIRTATGEFAIVADGNAPNRPYVQAASIGSRPLERPWVTHEEALDGQTLRLVMGSAPNASWGSDPGAAPPSLSA